MKKQTVDQKVANMKNLKPFITSKNMKHRKTRNDPAPVAASIPSFPQGFDSLYDYEEERRKIADKLFQKLLDSNVQNLKEIFALWIGKNRKLTPEI